MKKNLQWIFIAFLCINSNAQDLNLDQRLVNVNQSTVTSGIIYERVGQYSNLYNYNVAPFNRANTTLFEQALSELNRASNETKFISVAQLRNNILLSRQSQVRKSNDVYIGIINTPFQILNYNEEAPSQGGLNFNGQLFSQIAGKTPFLNMHVTMIAPLKEIVSGSTVTYKFENNLTFNYGPKTIKTLVADFGDGVMHTIMENGVIVLSAVTVTNNVSANEKSLQFAITYNDNSTFTTTGVLNLKGDPILSARNSSSLCTPDNLKEDLYSVSNPLVSDYSFQGYEEAAPIFGQIEARVFYHNNNGNTQKILLKPILVIDGFDPGDKRKIQACDYGLGANSLDYRPGIDHSIEDMMTYTASNGVKQNLIETLRAKGYDVVIVNHPTYSRNGMQINGGADYIERNAFNLVTLIQKINTKLVQNGSTEQLAIAAPSMGGQISRYALAYMEKKFAETNNTTWLHNTRLWISIDSPHLGANIPLGDQALLNLLKGESPAAADFVNNQLSSPAAQQQLIEFYKEGSSSADSNQNFLNAQTTGQGMPTNRGNSYFQNFYNSLNNNGLPNSSGFPQNTRKIALINGSLNGATFGTDSELVLNMRAFQKVNLGLFSFKIHVASLESNFMPAVGTSSKISRFKKAFKDKYTYSYNINSRGNMDIVPGGYYGAQDEISTSVNAAGVLQWGADWSFDNLIKSLSNLFGGAKWEQRQFKPIHSFIPSFSSLAHQQPNQNWGNRLDRNLVCSNETPFDSYYGTGVNTQHTSFTAASVSWLLKELDGIPQAPSFPIEASTLVGPASICGGTAAAFSLDICKVPSSVTWSSTGPITITANNPYSANITSSTYGGQATITATFQNGQTLTRNIHVGGPATYLSMFSTNPYSTYNTINPYLSTSSPITLSMDAVGGGNIGTYDWEWERVQGNIVFESSNGGSAYATVSNNGANSVGKYANIRLTNTNYGTIMFKTRAKNQCGWGNWSYYEVIRSGWKNANSEQNTFKVYPNPANDIVNVDLFDQDNKPAPKSDITVKLYDLFGREKAIGSTVNDNKFDIDIKNLVKGIYIVKVNVNGIEENHQLYIN